MSNDAFHIQKKDENVNNKWEMPIPSLTNFSDDKIYAEEIFVGF